MINPKSFEVQLVRDGRIIDAVNDACEEAIADISDPEKPMTKARSVTLKITFKPDEERTNIIFDASVKTSLPSKVAAVDMIQLDQEGNGFIEGANQVPMFDSANGKR